MVHKHLWWQPRMIRPIRIGLLAEGETELGKSIPYVTPQDGGKPIELLKEGALHTLIRRELELIGITDCEFIQRHPSLKESPKGIIKTGYSVAQVKYVKQAVLAWKDVDLIIILIDSDANLERRRQEIISAMNAVNSSHFLNDDDLIQNQSAGGLAVKNFETWLLADPNSIQELFGTGLNNPIADLENLPIDPANPNFSKNIFESILERSEFRIQSKSRGMEARWELAKTIDLAAIKTNCPQGYATFVEDLTLAAQNAFQAINSEEN